MHNLRQILQQFARHVPLECPLLKKFEKYKINDSKQTGEKKKLIVDKHEELGNNKINVILKGNTTDKI